MNDRSMVRKALLSDVAPLLKLINDYASQGIMLPRTEFELSENIRDFSVAVYQEELVGCGALHFYGTRTGEVRSLAVRPDRQKSGTGRRLMESLESEAVANGLESVFAFTYVPDFFAKLGFVEVDRHQLPSKVWKDCLRCPKLQCCDEIAMQKVLVPADAPPLWGEAAGVELNYNGALILPVVRKQ